MKNITLKRKIEGETHLLAHTSDNVMKFRYNIEIFFFCQQIPKRMGLNERRKYLNENKTKSDILVVCSIEVHIPRNKI